MDRCDGSRDTQWLSAGMFRASQREIVGTMAALCLTPRHPPAVRQGATSESCLPRDMLPAMDIG